MIEGRQIATERPPAVTGLPRIGVIFEAGAFSPLEIADAARDLCGLVWVTGWSSSQLGPIGRLLPRLGEEITVDGMSYDAIVARLRVAQLDGIVVFSDAAQELAAHAAQELELAFHSPLTARWLCDKVAQREALRRAGVPVPQTLAIDTSFDAAIDVGISWPAVLKPRRGSGGSETSLLREPAELAATLAAAPDGMEFILEEYLADRPTIPGRHAADLMSVELLVQDGVCTSLAASGRFPLVPPLRENGGFLPADLAEGDEVAATQMACDAAHALGVTHGMLHVELKLTPVGPRIVEVNGRVGGIVPNLMERAGGGQMLRGALRLALGLPIEQLPTLRTGSQVAFYYAWLAPVGEYELLELTGLREVMARPEIDRVWLNREVNDRVSSREGGMSGYIAAAYGTVASHEQLWTVAAELETQLQFRLRPLK